jgi:SAM-dependent methyltransferase
MPVNYEQSNGEDVLYQRDQYKKGGLTRLYWDYRDKIILENIPSDAKFIVDAGCGEGITLEKIFRFYPDRKISGIDISPRISQFASSMDYPQLRGTSFIFKLRMKPLTAVFFLRLLSILIMQNRRSQKLKGSSRLEEG